MKSVLQDAAQQLRMAQAELAAKKRKELGLEQLEPPVEMERRVTFAGIAEPFLRKVGGYGWVGVSARVGACV